jgi:hypothetical protein
MVGISTVRSSRPPIWQVASYTGLARPAGTDFRISTHFEGIAGNRNLLGQHAIDEGYTHVLFLDDDIQFPVDGLTRMLGWAHPAVSGLYFLRLGCLSVGNFTADHAWTPLRWPADHELEYVTMAAGGCLLLDTRILRAMKPPWWEFQPGHSEDVHFAYRLQAELGIPFLADLYVRCGHETATWLEPDGRATVKMEPRRVWQKPKEAGA